MQTRERKNLSTAIKAYHAAQKAVMDAEEILQKAVERQSTLESDLDAYAELDAEIAHNRAQQMKMALCSGDEHPMVADDSKFASKLVARDNIVEQLQRIEETLPTLESELESAKRRLYECDTARDLAAEKVIVAETNAMAVAHLEKLNEMRVEHYLLNFLAMQQVKRAPTENVIASVPGYLYGSGPTRRVAMPQAVIEAASENIIGTFEMKRGPFLRDRIGAEVSAYFRALKDDAGAMLNIEELRA